MQLLQKLVQEKLQNSRMSERQAAAICNVSQATIGRILDNEAVDLSTLLRVCAWLGVSPSSMMDGELSDDNNSLANALSVFIETDQQLADALRTGAKRVKEGNIKPEVIREIARYAAFILWLQEIDNDQYEI